MILFVVLVLFLKVLCLVDGDAKDEEDARSTKDILFDDVLCFVLSADFGLRVVTRKMTLVFDFNVTGSLTIQRLISRACGLYSHYYYYYYYYYYYVAVAVAFAVTAAIELGCTTRLFLLHPVSRGTSQTPRETLSRLARRVRPRVRTRLISPCYKIYLLSDQIGLE